MLTAVSTEIVALGAILKMPFDISGPEKKHFVTQHVYFELGGKERRKNGPRKHPVALGR